MFPIALYIALELRQPVADVALRHVRYPARRNLMLMPKATMHKNDFSAAGEYQIRFAGQVFPVQTIAAAHAVNKLPHNHLRNHILASDMPHYFRPPLYGYPVGNSVYSFPRALRIAFW